MAAATIAQWLIGVVLIFSSLGVILARKPVHASLYFLLSLLALAALYLQLSAQFIAVMQVIVYAGAILVLFVFVIVLFQDAYLQINKYKPQSSNILLIAAATAFVVSLVCLGWRIMGITPRQNGLPEGYGTVESLGKALYIDYFFPFEAIIFLFLIALVGALYIGKRIR